MRSIVLPYKSTNVRDTSWPSLGHHVLWKGPAESERFEVRVGDTSSPAWSFGGAGRPAVIFAPERSVPALRSRSFVPALVAAGYQAVLLDAPRASSGSLVEALEAAIDRVAARAPVIGLVGHGAGAGAIASMLQRHDRDLRVVMIAPRDADARPIRSHAAVLVIDAAGSARGLELARAWRGARYVAAPAHRAGSFRSDPAIVQDAIDFLADRVVFHRPPAPGETSAFHAPAALL
jgi:hypothetical protein